MTALQWEYPGIDAPAEPNCFDNKRNYTTILKEVIFGILWKWLQNRTKERVHINIEVFRKNKKRQPSIMVEV